MVRGVTTSGTRVEVGTGVKSGGGSSTSVHSPEINPCTLSQTPNQTAAATTVRISPMPAPMRQDRWRRRTAR